MGVTCVFLIDELTAVGQDEFHARPDHVDQDAQRMGRRRWHRANQGLGMAQVLDGLSNGSGTGCVRCS